MFRTAYNVVKLTLTHCRRMHKIPTNLSYINGQWVSAKDKKEFPVYNPFDGNIITNVPDCGVFEMNEAIHGSYEAFKTWSKTTAKERSSFLKALFELQMKNSNKLAEIMTSECGKPYNESVGEVSYGASFFEWFAEEARRIYGDIVPSPFKNKEIFFIKQPLGVAGIITPWNFPNAMITRKIAAALAAGCTCIIKPAEDTPLSAIAIAELAHEAKIPPGVINVVTCSRTNSSVMGKLMCEHPLIATISFTGSTAVGKLLLEYSAPFVKRVSLELGGNAPFIVFDSANMEKAVAGVMASKFRNTGQTCVCTNRILVQENVYSKFCDELAKAIEKQLVIGNGMDSNVNIGPLINHKAVEKVENHVKDAIGKGAKLILGGKTHPSGKCFYEPTLLTDITNNMLIFNEETFGPVAAVMKFRTEDEAIGIANSTSSGLAGYFYSEDISQIRRVAKLLEIGMVGINEGLFSTPEAAFGGIKQSGIGREGSRYGIDEYIYIKYICLGGLN